MKKRDAMNVILYLFFLSLILSSFSLTHAVDPVGIDALEEKVDQIQQTKEQFTNEESRSAWLREEWTKFFESKKTGRFILGISTVLQALSPLFKALIGIPYSFSWIFFITLGIWIALVAFIYDTIKISPEFKGIAPLGVAVIIAALGSYSGLLVQAVRFFEPLFTSIWVIFLAVLITIILLYLYSLIIKKLRKYMEYQQKREKEQLRERKANLKEKLDDVDIRSRGNN